MTSVTPAQRRLQLRPVPALLFLFFAGVTGTVLFDDVLHGAAITTAHITSVAVLVATIAAGHYVIPQARAGALVSALGLLVVFLAGTLYVVTSSGARNAETAANRQADAKEMARQRAELQRMKAEAGIILDACTDATPKKYHGIRCGLRDAMTAECKSGKGTRCDGAAYSVRTYETAVVGYDARIAALGPERSGDLYAHMGRVFAALPGVTAKPDAIAASLALILPYVLVAVVEIATLTFGGMAVRHVNVRPARPSGANRPAANPAYVREDDPAAMADDAQRLAAFLKPDTAPDGRTDTPSSGSGHDPDDSGPPKGTRNRTSTRMDGRTARSAQVIALPVRTIRADAPAAKRDQVLAALLADLADGRTFSSQAEICEAYGIARSTLSDWLRAWEVEGVSFRRAQQGRVKHVARA